MQLIDFASVEIARWRRIERNVEELSDVVVLSDTVRPKALGFKTNEIRHNVWFEDDGQHRHWRGADKPR